MLKYPRKLVIPHGIQEKIEQNIINTISFVILFPELEQVPIYNTSYIYSRDTDTVHIITKGCNEFDDYYFIHKIYHGVVFDHNHFGNYYFRNKNYNNHYETTYKHIESTKTTVYINKPVHNSSGILISNFNKISIASTDIDQTPLSF